MADSTRIPYLVKPMNRLSLIVLFLLAACQVNEQAKDTGKSFGEDSAFLSQYDPTLIQLQSSDGNARMIVSPKYQGRVMTSTAAGPTGRSYGWINYDLISSRRFRKQFNPVGGEERLWLGPEGGQYSLYFPPGDSFNIKNWQVPAVIDTMSYAVKSKTDSSATFEARAKLLNYTGTTFDITLMRGVELLRRHNLETALDITIGPDINAVGYRTVNAITNNGKEAWTHEKGLISIWLLGMFTPSQTTTVIVPFANDADTSLISKDYFGDIPSDRLSIRSGILLFKCDGKYRSKLGFPPQVRTGLAGSYDTKRKVLTIIRFDVDLHGDYVNSKWKIHEEPYKGDAFNTYNDGPLADGTQLGPFYELESSSPVLPLKPDETQTYTQVTCHFEGDFEALNKISRSLLHFDLNDLKTFP
jgi:hypothetical protein